MDKISINVSITPREAKARITDRISADLVHQEYHGLGNKEIIVLVFEKFFFRNSSTAGLTVTISNETGNTQVTAVASAGGQGIFNISWGANASFAYQVETILEPYRIGKYSHE